MSAFDPFKDCILIVLQFGGGAGTPKKTKGYPSGKKKKEKKET